MREVEDSLNERDRLVIADIAKVRLLTAQQLRRLHYGDSDADRRQARRDLARLVDQRVLARLTRRIGGVRAGSDGFVYGLDVLGQRLIAPERRRYRSPWTPDPAFLAHVVAVSELYVQLRERARTSVCEVARFDAEPACWRIFSGPGGRRLVLKPDAFLIALMGGFEDRYFIEVDRSTESLPRISEKARLYGRHWQSGHEQEQHGIYPQVLWIAPNEQRQQELMDALGRIDPDYWRLFLTTTGERAGDLISGDVEHKAGAA